MKWYRAIRVNQKIKLKPMRALEEGSVRGRRRSIRISHEIQWKPMKAMKRLLRFWM